jgi:hypothetical protein
LDSLSRPFEKPLKERAKPTTRRREVVPRRMFVVFIGVGGIIAGGNGICQNRILGEKKELGTEIRAGFFGERGGT